MGFRPDPQQAAPPTGRFRPDAAPVKLGPSPAAVGAEDILGNDRMQQLSANPHKQLENQSPEPSIWNDVANYGNKLNDAAATFNKAKPAGLAGIADAGLSAASSAVAPAIANFADMLGLGNNEDVSKAVTYEPRTESGQALTGMLGAAMEPLADSGADVALMGMVPDAPGAVGGPRAYGVKTPKAAAAVDPILAEKRNVARDIRGNNIKLTPKEHSKLTGDKNYVGRALQAVAGDTKVSADMAAKNQSTINDMGRKAVGSETLTDKGLKPVKDTGNAVYSEMSKLGNVAPTPELSAAIEKARGSASKSTERNVDIDNLVDSTLSQIGGSGPSNLTSDQIVTKVRELRRDSQNNFKGEGEKRPTVQKEALGAAQRQIADALDDFLEYHAATSGKPELAEKYKANRVRLAKVGTVEQATEAGNLNAKQLKDAKQKGAGLTGKLGDIATANEYAPQSTAPNANEALLDAPGRNLDILELPVAALQNVVRHMGVNKILQSDWYQNKLGAGGAGHEYDYPVGPVYGPDKPAPGIVGPPAPERPPAPPSVDFAGELGLAPDAGPRDVLPGVPTQAARTLMDELSAGLGLTEDAPVQGGPPQRTGPQGDIDLGAEDPNGPFKFARGEQFNDARPVSGVQRGAAMDTGDLSIAPDAPTGPQDQMPPRPRRLPRQGGAPVEPKPRPAPAAPAAPAEAPADVQSLGQMIDEMLSAGKRNRETMQNPAQQQQAQAQPNFADALGLSLEDAPTFDRSAAPELGADAGGEPLDQRFGMPAPTRVTSGNGYISYIPGGDGVRQITGAFVKAADRGKGAGTANLMKLVDDTATAGEKLNSDASVSHDQLKVYQKLRDSGKIEFDTDEKAFAAALAGKKPMKGKTPVITNIRPVTKQ